MTIQQYIKNNILILDGAMGTMLQEFCQSGESPIILNIKNPEAVKAVHRAYFTAGSNLVASNTFGAYGRKLQGYTAEEIITAGVKLAKEAAAEFSDSGVPRWVALDIGSIGEFLEPLGDITREAAYEIVKEQVIAGASAGADAIYIETMTDLEEARIAVVAAKENCNLPVLCTMSFEENMRTFMGADITAASQILEAAGADFIGINCSVGPAKMREMAEEMLKHTRLPVIIKPNAGLPEFEDGKTVFNVTPEDFAAEMKGVAELGVSAIGGCCGTTPEFIRAIHNS